MKSAGQGFSRALDPSSAYESWMVKVVSHGQYFTYDIAKFDGRHTFTEFDDRPFPTSRDALAAGINDADAQIKRLRLNLISDGAGRYRRGAGFVETDPQVRQLDSIMEATRKLAINKDRLV